ncbi:MAG: murein hydrolase activator EnvC family protein [Moorellaceae bacterium]
MRFISGLIVGLFLLIGAIQGWASSANPQEELERRLQEVNSQEYIVLQELLQVDARLQNIAHKRVVLAAQQEQLKRELVEAQEKEKKLSAQLAASRESFSQSLRFFQRHGTTPYLATAILSDNFSDFFIRWELLQRYVNFLGNRVRYYLELHTRAQETKEEMQRKEKEMALAAAQMARLEQQLLDLRQAREATLARLRQQVADYQQALLAWEQAWQKALVPLQYLLTNFPYFPWENLSPDKINIDHTRGRVLAEFTQSKINSVLLRGQDSLEGVSFELTPEGLIIPGPEFRLKGRLTVAGPHQLLFTPQSLELAGLPLDRSVWEVFLPSPTFTIELPPPAFNLKFNNLEMMQGVMVLELLPSS